jgi:hypothetical protein
MEKIKYPGIKTTVAAKKSVSVCLEAATLFQISTET